jgi:ABC-type lipoprotein export system ATPase subunit
VISNFIGFPADSLVPEALTLPNGARFYKCALQVNPFEYSLQHAKQHGFPDEESYNRALVDALIQEGIEVIAVTDHWRVLSSKKLIEAAQAEGIHVFSGFEASTRDGVHMLCLFEGNSDLRQVDRCATIVLGHGEPADGSPLGSKTLAELLKLVKDHGGICIAPHITQQSGLLTQLRGQARVKAWCEPTLQAGCIPGSLEDLKPAQDYYAIVGNTNPEYRRQRPLAVINAGDVSSPTEVSLPGKWTQIKMANVSIEGLRQAFLDPDSRIRLASESIPDGHVELVAMTWEGGFLDGVIVHFNENLNVLVGGRGTGKSTIIESIRYVLGAQALGKESQRAHESMISYLLGSGAKVTLVVRLHHPNEREYLLERTYPNPPVVRDETGNILGVAPSDVLPLIDIYGQHEIAELARDNTKLTHLLHRFLPPRHETEQERNALSRDLKNSRQQLLKIDQQLEDIEQRLTHLPRLQETLRQYKAAGIEEKLTQQTRLQREGRLFSTVNEQLQPIDGLLSELRSSIPLDRDYISAGALKDYPNASLLNRLNGPLEKVDQAVGQAVAIIASALQQARQEVGTVENEWKPLNETAQASFQLQLRELQKERIDGNEVLRLQRQIDELHPLERQKQSLQAERIELDQRRRNLLGNWETLLLNEHRALEKAAKKVNRQLAERVRVKVVYQQERGALRAVLDKALAPAGGQRKPIIDAIEASQGLSLRTLAAACRGNISELQQTYSLTPSQAQKLAGIGSDACFQLEELELSSITQVELNVASRGNQDWHDLSALSVGQRATAVLLLLLLEALTPLVVDQPEDDLDNRFIADDIVPIIKREKLRRQFVFATHNANIPVLGDAELILGLEANQGQAAIYARGSLDTPEVHTLVEEVLEGGREAFETRRAKYDF